ncbi:unnamed protein product, partial [Symbiodinium sp. KB8]
VEVCRRQEEFFDDQTFEKSRLQIYKALERRLRSKEPMLNWTVLADELDDRQSSSSDPAESFLRKAEVDAEEEAAAAKKAAAAERQSRAEAARRARQLQEEERRKQRQACHQDLVLEAPYILQLWMRPSKNHDGSL